MHDKLVMKIKFKQNDSEKITIDFEHSSAFTIHVKDVQALIDGLIEKGCNVLHKYHETDN